MATDKRLDQVSTLTDFDYALIVKGDQVAKASKQQLAELVGNLLYGATNASSLATVVAEQFIVNSEPHFSIATNHPSVIGIVWGRDYINKNSVAYIFVGSVGGGKVFMYEIGKQGNPSITATISGRDITFTTNSLDEFFYFKF